MPLVGLDRDRLAGLGLAEPLVQALVADVDLDHALAREEHSLVVRRAAFRPPLDARWRTALAGPGGVRHAGLPAVSALLATKRPQMLDFALRQVARQRGADVELVLAAHGFEPDRDAVRRALGDRPHQVLTFDDATFFGDVLTAAAHAASSEVLLKVDDDDWYAPDAVHDLLMARRFSGADVVGMPSEFVFLHANDEREALTVRRNHPSEVFARFVAGGTLLLDRGLLGSLGDFRRVRKFVDAQLLAGVEAAGGRIYRPHGLGYVLRRTGAGHTWQRDDEEFRRPDIVPRSGRVSVRACPAGRPGRPTGRGRHERGGVGDGPATGGAPQRLGRAHAPGVGAWEPTLSVTVVVPTFNYQRTLPYVLAGLAAQSYPSHLLEVLVVDDQSSPPQELPEVRPEHTRLVRVEEGWGARTPATSVRRSPRATCCTGTTPTCSPTARRWRRTRAGTTSSTTRSPAGTSCSSTRPRCSPATRPRCATGSRPARRPTCSRTRSTRRTSGSRTTGPRPTTCAPPARAPSASTSA